MLSVLKIKCLPTWKRVIYLGYYEQVLYGMAHLQDRELGAKPLKWWELKGTFISGWCMGAGSKEKGEREREIVRERGKTESV